MKCLSSLLLLLFVSNVLEQLPPPIPSPPLPLANECVSPEPLIGAFKKDGARQAFVMSELLQMLFHPPFFL